MPSIKLYVKKHINHPKYKKMDVGPLFPFCVHFIIDAKRLKSAKCIKFTLFSERHMYKGHTPALSHAITWTLNKLIIILECAAETYLMALKHIPDIRQYILMCDQKHENLCSAAETVS